LRWVQKRGVNIYVGWGKMCVTLTPVVDFGGSPKENKRNGRDFKYPR